MNTTLVDMLQPHLPAEALAALKASARQVLEIHTEPAPADLPLTASRIGGIGYWPQNQPYPHNANDKPLALLAQFNFAELPHHPDLPKSGILAFYIDPFDYSYGMDAHDSHGASGYRSVYFADISTPSLSREAQRALFPQEAFAQEHDDAEDAADNDDDETDYTDAENDFQQRWLEDSQALLSQWLARRADAVAQIDDADLTRHFQAERAALPPLAELAAQVDAYCNKIEKKPPSGSHMFAALLDDDYFPASNARAAKLTGHAEIVRWNLADQELPEADLMQSVYVHQVLTQQLITSGDTRWWQYWQHDPRAVIECDWQMQKELIDAYDDAALSALWAQTEASLRPRLDAIVAEAQQKHIMSAPELDQLLEHHARDAMQQLREAFAALPPAHQAHIRTLEMRILQSRMDRLAKHFAAQGFVAEGQAPHDAYEAVQNFSALTNAELTQGSGNPLAGLDKLLAGMGGEDLFGFEPESEAERTEVATLLADYIAENDAFIAEQNNAELTRLWQDERDNLRQTPPQSKSALANHLAIGSLANRNLMRMGIVNPVAAKLSAQLYGVEYPDLSATTPQWSHPVDGEYALSARFATHYLLTDSVEYHAHFGISAEQWREQNGLNGDDSMRFIARAQYEQDIADIYAQQHESHFFGYPRFAQEDPRFYERSDDVLLFQLDSDAENFRVQWGDCGAGQFFIARKDLADQRFDKAWFYWDCF